MSAPVLVGVDGSSSALAAVETAAGEARMRGCGLRVVYAYSWPPTYLPPGPVPLAPVEDGLREAADRTLEEAATRARSAAPGVAVSHSVRTGPPRMVLEEESRDAGLVVVGSRGLGRVTGVLLGSTAVHLAAHARCPVLVVREAPGEDDAVLVGVDGSPAGEHAVGFAFAEAALRGAGVLALHAWTPWSAPVPPPQDPAQPYASPPGALEAGEERLLAEALAGHRERYPDVAVEHRLVREGAREALIWASARAGLLVVGARGRGGFSGLLLGSVSQAVVHHAQCPVVVVRQPGGHR
ncbi:universal stress protein [Streptomyces sp. JJ36]|uniref:universal stress protein n=1 Tax=Streptomyces sp. JJ36 TaxID=2736645 RepID=UPI001F43E9AE|nr:universal stress protein [Streptomyces sp. JJ36]MCF6523973.1 universal stress protein [Streptomyces sp. JJ36]